MDVTLHSYRCRWDEAAPDQGSVWLEEEVKATRSLSLPALYVQGEVDGINPPPVSEAVGDRFTGPSRRVVLPGVGRFPQRGAAPAGGTGLANFLRAEPHARRDEVQVPQSDVGR
nr:hypothetical protein [uncultured Lichenicoccus sp.]